MADLVLQEVFKDPSIYDVPILVVMKVVLAVLTAQENLKEASNA